MEIIIKENKASERAVEFNQLYWKAYAKKANQVLYLCIFPGLAFLTYDILNFDSPGFTFSLGTKQINANLHLGLGIGITLLYLVYYILYRRQKEKHKFLVTMNLAIPKLYNPTNTTTTTITDNSISLECDSFKTQTSWSLFASFTIVKDYLVLYKFGGSTPIYIYKKSMTDSDYETLLSTLRQSKKEIKENRFPFQD